VGHERVLVLAGEFEVFDGLGKLAGSRLHLFEQARGFDRDYGLIRKGIDELDLKFGERTHFGAPNEDHPNCLTAWTRGTASAVRGVKFPGLLGTSRSEQLQQTSNETRAERLLRWFCTKTDAICERPGVRHSVDTPDTWWLRVAGNPPGHGISSSGGS